MAPVLFTVATYLQLLPCEKVFTFNFAVNKHIRNKHFKKTTKKQNGQFNMEKPLNFVERFENCELVKNVKQNAMILVPIL